MHNEHYSILYSSVTGNTRLLADTIRAALPPELCDAFGAWWGRRRGAGAALRRLLDGQGQRGRGHAGAAADTEE